MMNSGRARQQKITPQRARGARRPDLWHIYLCAVTRPAEGRRQNYSAVIVNHGRDWAPLEGRLYNGGVQSRPVLMRVILSVICVFRNLLLGVIHILLHRRLCNSRQRAETQPSYSDGWQLHVTPVQVSLLTVSLLSIFTCYAFLMLIWEQLTQTLCTPGVNICPEWCDHRWTALSTGVNETHWDLITQTSFRGGLDHMRPHETTWDHILLAVCTDHTEGPPAHLTPLWDKKKKKLSSAADVCEHTICQSPQQHQTPLTNVMILRVVSWGGTEQTLWNGYNKF